MGKTQKDWARRWRSILKWLLRGRCALCGSDEDLEFDCIRPRGDTHHRFDTSERMSFYRKQFLLGNLQLLCKKCHGKKSKNENSQLNLFTNEPTNEPTNNDNEPF